MDGASWVRIHNITGYLRDQLQVDPIGDATPVERIHTTGPSSTVEKSPTMIIENVVPTVNEDPDVTQLRTQNSGAIYSHA
ncbi:hypothetical protein KY289_011786 [Solanum tuberosum]|nr:hypothetical protein KY289_011786 [Solanum tuberosum]